MYFAAITQVYTIVFRATVSFTEFLLNLAVTM